MTRDGVLHRVFVLWCVIAAPPVLIVLAQTIAGKYGDDASLIWNWLLAQITPVMSLLLAAVFSSPSKAWRRAAANPVRWRYTLVASVLQGVFMTGILLIEPLVSVTSFTLIELSAVPLSLLQGIVVACVGAVVFDGR